MHCEKAKTEAQLLEHKSVPSLKDRPKAHITLCVGLRFGKVVSKNASKNARKMQENATGLRFYPIYSVI